VNGVKNTPNEAIGSPLCSPLRVKGEPMPLIKKQEKKIVRTMTFRIEEEVAEQMSAYAKYLDSSQDHVVNEALRYIMDRDKEFQARSSEILLREEPAKDASAKAGK
jgi:hypothetical protein